MTDHTSAPALCEMAYALGRDHFSADVEGRDRRGARDDAEWRPLWDLAAGSGILGLAMPAAYGGSGLGILETIRILHRLGEGCRDSGMLLALNGQMWAMQMSILAFGTEEQRAAWLPPLISGERLCAHAVTEAASGSNAMAMTTRAEPIAGGYRITGEKVWVGMGPRADVAQVFAATNPDHGAWGLSVFLVDLDLPGVHRGEIYDKVGHRTVPTGPILFDRVEIPAAARLGPEGAGQAIFNQSIDWERRFIFAGHVGAMKRQLGETVRFARERRPGGVPIGDFQSVSNRLADMHLRWESSRLLIENAARELDEGRAGNTTAATVKLHVSEALLANAEDALRIRAGQGYMTGETERMLRDAAGCITLGGTSDIQRRIIASLLRPAPTGVGGGSARGGAQ